MSVDLRSQRVGFRFNFATYFNNRVCQRDVAEVLDMFECQMGMARPFGKRFGMVLFGISDMLRIVIKSYSKPVKGALSVVNTRGLWIAGKLLERLLELACCLQNSRSSLLVGC